ncbi:hypothetical protein E2C01_091128 [Portunus trituberculatus]|uniref:Uncharacterized protein n=1 Tax=Portunus trituberculatus TaxID=210409 RepID=A0A5B7JM61_PORTR|nr:hypothetical protein [Portunus trituberculatus]
MICLDSASSLPTPHHITPHHTTPYHALRHETGFPYVNLTEGNLPRHSREDGHSQAKLLVTEHFPEALPHSLIHSPCFWASVPASLGPLVGNHVTSKYDELKRS